MPDGGLDPDLRDGADDRERVQAAVPQDELERCPLEHRHRQLVEDGLARSGRDLRDQLVSR